MFFKPYFEKFYNVTYCDKDIINYFENNKLRALYYIEEANGTFSQRSFWGSIGNFFKNVGKGIVNTVKTVGHAIATVGTSIAAGITFGQINELNDAVKVQFNKTTSSFLSWGESMEKISNSGTEIFIELGKKYDTTTLGVAHLVSAFVGGVVGATVGTVIGAFSPAMGAIIGFIIARGVSALLDKLIYDAHDKRKKVYAKFKHPENSVVSYIELR